MLPEIPASVRFFFLSLATKDCFYSITIKKPKGKKDGQTKEKKESI